MFEDRDMMKHPICPMSQLDCYLTDHPLYVRYAKLLYHKFISGPTTPGIFIMFTGVKVLLINRLYILYLNIYVYIYIYILEDLCNYVTDNVTM